MTILIFSLMTLLPGAWLAFGLPLGELSWKVRLALGAALSPAILGLQLLALKFGGLSFNQAALVILIGNLPALILILRRLPSWKTLHWSPTFLAGGALLLMLIGYIVIPWATIQNYRPFAWHALWHTDIVYSLTRTTIAPEEPELAGLTLDYGWLGHAYWAIVGWGSNLPPTITYAISNLIWLLIAFLLAYELIRRGLGLQSSAAYLGVGLLFLGTNMTGVILWLLAHDMYRWQFYLGDIRYTPFLSKYLGFETMPFGFALTIGLALICLLGLRQPIKWLPGILTSLLTALGLIYPILFPIGCLLTGGMLLLFVTKLAPNLPAYTRRQLLWMGVGIGFSIASFIGFMLFVTQDRTESMVHLSTRHEMLAKSFHVLSALAPLGLVALPYTLKYLWQRQGPVLLLTATALGLMAMYVIFDLAALEYKYILGATIMLAPLSAAGLDQLFFQKRRLRWAWTLAIPLALAVMNQALMYQTGAQLPDNRVNAPAINEQAFWLQLAPSEPDAAWTTAVRTETPLDTILVTNNSQIHLGPFVARALYLPSDRSGQDTTGYSVDNRFNLLEWRGYPQTLYAQRQQTTATLYDSSDKDQLATVLYTFIALDRPVAFHFADPKAGALLWLRQIGVGKQLFADNKNVVWLIDPKIEIAKNSLNKISQQR
ncbi:MAG: hypothetical protein NT075_01830 [Chloroflexi bacterium]|nr:hypothetical protein [Chloroflexota bacterium]